MPALFDNSDDGGFIEWRRLLVHQLEKHQEAIEKIYDKNEDMLLRMVTKEELAEALKSIIEKSVKTTDIVNQMQLEQAKRFTELEGKVSRSATIWGGLSVLIAAIASTLMFLLSMKK